jgi:tetratricopeptide (TPR) repeat protein
MAMLGQVLARRRAFDQALPLIQRAISGDRKRADYYALAGEVLTVSGRPAEALARFDEALRLRPQYDAAIAGRTDALLRLGRRDEAVAAAQAGPDTPVLAGIHARALRRTKQHQAALDVVARHLPADGEGLETRRTLLFEQAHAAEGLGLVDLAAEALYGGNALSASDFDDAAAEAAVDEVIDFFSVERMATLPRTEQNTRQPVFVVGMLRGGSTLVEQIIASHPQGAGAGELEALGMLAVDLGQRVDAALPYPQCLQETNEHMLDSVARSYLKVLRQTDGKALRIVDKQMGNVALLGLAGLLLPGARVISCTRHPLDQGLSCWSQKLAPGTNAWAASQRSIAGIWLRARRLMDHWQAVAPLPILQVRYEDLVQDLEGQVRRMLTFLDLPFDEACLRFWETKRTVLTLSQDQVARPLYSTAVGRHAPWGSHLDELRLGLGDAVSAYEGGS